MNLEVVSDDRNHPLEASLKVSSRSNIRNLVKIQNIHIYSVKHYVTDRQTDRRTETHPQLFN